MLHGVIVSSTSGLVLFHKEFVHRSSGVDSTGTTTTAPLGGGLKAKQVGGVLTAMLKFSAAKVGLPVSYIHLSGVCVSIACSAEARVTCACFHDGEDGAEFGALLSRELLAAFVRQFAHELAATPVTHQQGHAQQPQQAGTGMFAMDHFLEFQSQIAEVIRNAAKPLLDQLQEQRGISLVLLSSASAHDAHDSAPSSALQYSTQEVDKLAVLANHQALMGVATDIMGGQNDTANSVILRSRRTTLILLRVERSSLVVVFKNSVDATVCLAKIEKTAELVRKVLAMAANLKT